MENGISNHNLYSCESDILALGQRGYKTGKKIGKGSYATVITSQYIEDENKKTNLACKIVDKTKAPKDFLDKFFPRELDILTKIEHPHIIQIHSILQRGPKVFIFMRYAENGDLLDYIKTNGALSENRAKIWFHQMAKALKYLHTMNVAHRDLKCENILITKRMNVKLADFGFARHCSDFNGQRILSHTYCGSAAYAAPEILCSAPYNPKIADIWSLGIILFIMLNSLMPFDDKNLKKLLNDQKNRRFKFRSKYINSISMECQTLVRMLLEPDITKRWNLEHVLKCEWIYFKNMADSKNIHDIANKNQ